MYLQFDTTPKPLTTKEGIGRGQVDLPALSPPLFLELQLVKLHTHEGSDSRQLKAKATPEMVRGYRPSEREEHGVVTWEGASAASGSVVLAFATSFLEAPEVFVTPQSGTANIIVGTGTPTTSGVTIYWKDNTATTHTAMPLAWLAKGR